VQRISELFTRYSHHCPPRPASGLRLEIGPNMDKKKSELYFSSPVKKFLTEKRNGVLRRCSKSRARAVASEEAVEMFCSNNRRGMD
jgi:hypothetical protein